MKCFDGIDYGKVYKQPKNLDSSAIDQYARGELIPSRRFFWKVLYLGSFSHSGTKKS